MDSSQFILNTRCVKEERVLALPSRVCPESVTCRSGNTSTINFSNGVSCRGACLHCPNKPCINYHKRDFDFVKSFPGFTHDRDMRVCATDAIAWDDTTNTPYIVQDKCVKCGCCAMRCPVRAIYFSHNQFRICRNSDAPQTIFRTVRNADVGRRYVSTEYAFVQTRYQGNLVNESDALINDAYKRLVRFTKRDSRIPNLITRNLLMALKIDAASSRRGDVYSRTDILFACQGKLGICEVEFNDAMIDTPRDIVEDIAIYVSRYGINKDKIEPLIVGLQYPNRRSEFWEVLTDIENVLGIRTRSLSICALMLLVWNQFSFRSQSIDYIPVIDNRQKGIRNGISSMMGRKINLGADIDFNALEPMK